MSTAGSPGADAAHPAPGVTSLASLYSPIPAGPGTGNVLAERRPGMRDGIVNGNQMRPRAASPAC